METDESALIEESRASADRTEQLFTQRTVDQYGEEIASKLLEIEDIKVTTFVEAYIQGGYFPISRVLECTLRAIDLRLQFEYIAFDLGHANLYLYDESGQVPPSTAVLARMALDQSVIGRSRIVWEKIFRLVYFLENGFDLNDKRGVKKKFFTWAADNARWRFLEVYEDDVTRFDAAFRTPEYHKHSIVRAHLLHGTVLDHNELLKLSNRARQVPMNIVSVLRTGENQVFSDLHMNDPADPAAGLNKRYLRNASGGGADPSGA